MAIERRVPEASGLRQLFQEQWDHVHQLLTAAANRHEAERKQWQEDQRAVDALVAGTNPQLKAVFRYREQLRIGVRGLLEHVDGLVESLPAPIDTRSESCLQDPRIQAFFGGNTSFQDIFRCSPDLQRHFEDPDNAVQVTACAVLFMHKQEKQVTVEGGDGDLQPPDAVGTDAGFADPVIALPSIDEAHARSALKGYLFDRIVEYLNCRLGRLRAQRRSPRLANASDLTHPAIYLEHLSRILRSPLELLSRDTGLLHIDHRGLTGDGPYTDLSGGVALRERRLGGIPLDVITLVTCSRAQMAPQGLV